MAHPRMPATVEVGAAATLSGFHLGRTPVTNAEYATFVASGRAPEPPWWRDPGFHAADQPVVGVTWFEAADFAAWLTELTRERWRLPTEAEWEHAACGGLVGAGNCLGRRAARGRDPGRAACRALAGRPRPSQRIRPPRHGHDRPRVVPRLVRRRAGSTREPRRFLAAPRALVSASRAEQPAARVPLRRLRLPDAPRALMPSGRPLGRPAELTGRRFSIWC